MEETATVPRGSVMGWIRIFRAPPFYLVGVLPFSLGVLIAVREGNPMSWAVWAIGCVALALIMAMTFLVNEYYDFETDSANVNFNQFTGGSRVLPDGLIERRTVLVAAGLCTAIALALGLVIQFGFHRGPLSLPLGAVAALMGYAYTAPPLRIIYRGLGEPLIGISVGWIPVLIGYYLIAGMPTGAMVHLMSLPTVLGCIMLIVVNEFPDYESDKASGKLNLAVRLGRERAAWVFTVLGVLLAATLAYLGFTYLEGWRRYILAAPLLFSLDMSTAIQFGAWKTKRLTALCFGTIILNLVTMVLLLVVNW